MKRPRTKILTGIALLAAVILVAGIVGAKATRTAVEGDVVITSYSPGREWWSNGILHMRDVGMTFAMTGDVQGTGGGTVNNNFDPQTGNGQGWGTEFLDVTWGDLSGTFEGSWTQKVTNFQIVGESVLHGSGDFAGMLMKSTFTATWGAPGYGYEALILDPHGE